MLRVLWQEVRDRIHDSFAQEGLDLRAEHLAVLQYPGPDGQRPSVLAARAGVSRQTINHLLGHLQRAGYVERYTDPANATARLVRLTPDGRRLYTQIQSTAAAVEAEWAERIGPVQVEQLRRALIDLLAPQS